MSSRSNIVFVPTDKTWTCWTCGKRGPHLFLDRAIDQRYCDLCASEAIGIDHMLSEFFRSPTKGEVQLLRVMRK